MAVLVMGECAAAGLSASTRSTLTAALAAGSEAVVMLCGADVSQAAAQAAACPGVTEVIAVNSPALAECLPEAVADAAAQLQGKRSFTHIFFPESSLGKAAMPRLAGLLSAPALSGIVAVKAPDTFSRFVYAGGALMTVKVSGSPVLATVRATAFEPAAPEGGSAPVTQEAYEPKTRCAKFVSRQARAGGKVDLLTARRVVSGGRGLDEPGFALLREFAAKIGAAEGSTRAAVDLGLASNETQVGQTGKIVAPDLYFAFALSGAMQHVAGMKDSGVIVSVNKDPEAPVFDVSDYYLVDDAEKVLKELIAKV